jgi:hypothetical protein
MWRCQLFKLEELRELPAFDAMPVDYCALGGLLTMLILRVREPFHRLIPGLLDTTL